jgi:hypothetical protein
VVVRGRILAVLPVGLAIAACDNPSSPDAFASYDDCIIATVSDAPNADAINVLTSSCARKFEQKVDLSLDVSEAVDSDVEISIQNDTDFIVTKMNIDAGDLGSWSLEDTIEPGSFINIQTPKNAREINAAAKKGTVSAKAFRAIPVKSKE